MTKQIRVPKKILSKLIQGKMSKTQFLEQYGKTMSDIVREWYEGEILVLEVM